MSVTKSRKGRNVAAPAPTSLTARLIIPIDDGYRVPGVALVTAKPFRSRLAAREFAERIAGDADGYMAVIVNFDVPGIIDLRPRCSALNVTAGI